MDYTDDSCMLTRATPESGFLKSVGGLSIETEFARVITSPRDVSSAAEMRAPPLGLIYYNGHAGLGADLVGRIL
jgi:hypothetical protein